MSDKKLSQLTELTSVAPDDLVYVADTSASASRRVQASNLGGVWAQTTEESSAGVTPSDYRYPPGDVRRYGVTGDGSTDGNAGRGLKRALRWVPSFPGRAWTSREPVRHRTVGKGQIG